MPDEDQDDELRTALLAKLKEATVEDEDEDGIGATIDHPKMNDGNVSVEDGINIVEDAKFAKSTEKAFQKSLDDGAPKPAVETPAVPALAAPADLAATAVTDLLTDLDDTKRAEVTRRIGEADAFKDLFKPYADQLKMYGNVTEAQAMARMLQLNAFAQAKPDEYLAWVATEMNAEAPHTVLEAAAAHLGYKLVPAVEVDEFEDEATKALREENAALKRAQGLNYGPDAPANQTQRAVQTTVQAFEQAKDDAGNLRHPALNYDVVRGAVAVMAREHRDTTGHVATLDDLSRFYDTVTTSIKDALGISAAQPVFVVPPVTPAAPGIEKAKAASKMIDGSGQGADRRPALNSDATTRDVIKAALRAQTEG